jgi:effector-binding domain-containing protein
VDLPEIERAATIVHRGSMDDVMPTIQTLAAWIDANGYRSTGYRELYIEVGEDRDTWVTELQEPIVAATG